MIAHRMIKSIDSMLALILVIIAVRAEIAESTVFGSPRATTNSTIERKVHSTEIAPDGNAFILNDLQLANLKATIETEDFKFFAEKMSLSARVVTAINLRNGLSDGSIPLDDVIEELLNIRSGSLKQLENFDKKKADGYLNQMLKVGNEVKDDSVDVEKEILAVFEMWTILENNDVSYDIPTKEEISKLDGLKTWNYDALKTLNIDNVISSIDKASTNADFKSSVNSFLNALKTADESLKDSTIVMDVLTKIYKLRILSSLLGIYKTANLRLIKSTTANLQNELKANFMKLDGLKLEDAGMLNVVGVIPGPQHSSISKEKKFTSGFVEGHKDLGKLQSDIKDPWFISSLKPSTSLEGVLSLRKLESGMKEVEEHWTSLSTTAKAEGMRKVSVLSLLSDSAKDATKEVDAAFNTLFKCFPKLFPEVIDDVETIVTKGGDFFSMLTNLESMKKLTSSSAFTGLLSSNKKEDFQKLSSMFKLVKSNVEVFRSDRDLPKKVGEVHLSASRAAETTNADSLKKFEETFTCLKKNGPGLSKVMNAARLVSQLRDLKTDTTISKTIGDVTSAVSQSTASLKKVKKTAEEVKKENSKEVKSLEVYKDLKVASNPFGQSVVVLMTVRDALGKSAALDSLATDGTLVEKLLDSENYLQASKFESEFRKNWPAFGELVQKIKSFLHEVGKQFAKVKDLKSAKFPSFGSFFVDLATLPKVDIQADKRLAVVKRLKPLVTGKNDKKTLGEIEKSLEDVSSLDLDFTRFESSLKGMPSTMNQISLSFAKSSKNTTKVPAQEEDEEEETTTVAALDFYKETWFLIVAIVVGLALIFGVPFLVCNFWKGSPYNNWRENKKKKKGSTSTAISNDPNDSKASKASKVSKVSNNSKSKESSISKESKDASKDVAQVKNAKGTKTEDPKDAKEPEKKVESQDEAASTAVLPTSMTSGASTVASGTSTDASGASSIASSSGVSGISTQQPMPPRNRREGPPDAISAQVKYFKKKEEEKKRIEANRIALDIDPNGFAGEGENGKTQDEVADPFGSDKKDRKTAGEDGFSVLKFLKSLFSRRKDDEDDDASGMAGAVA